MNRLERLRTSLIDMTGEELLDKVREVRADRKVLKKTEKPVSAVKKDNTMNKIQAILASMSAEEKAKFLAEMGDAI